VRLVWSSLALKDRQGIFDYIEVDSPGAAISVDERIAGKIEGLKTFPKSGRPGRVPGTREIVIVGTPFVAVYRIAEDRIRILRVLHGARLWPSPEVPD